MLGPYLQKTEFLFKLPMSKQILFKYNFREKLYQYVIGCYRISSQNIFFCRVNRSKSTSKNVRMFLIPMCKSKYTSIELTCELPCAFITTPTWVVVMLDTIQHKYTGHLDPRNGSSLWVESQGNVESFVRSVDDMLSSISSYTYVTPYDLSTELPDVINDKYIPRGHVLNLPELHFIEDQSIIESANIVKMLLTITSDVLIDGSSIVEKHSGVNNNYDSLSERLKKLKSDIGILSESNHSEPFIETHKYERNYESVDNHKKADPNTVASNMIHAWRKAGKVLSKLDPLKYTFHNLCLLTYEFWAKSASVPPITTLDIPTLLLSFVDIAKHSVNNSAEYNDKTYQSYRLNAKSVNDVVIANIYEYSKLVNETMLNILFEFASEVINIDEVTKSDLLPFMIKTPSKNRVKLVELSKRPVLPSESMFDDN